MLLLVHLARNLTSTNRGQSNNIPLPLGESVDPRHRTAGRQLGILDNILREYRECSCIGVVELWTENLPINPVSAQNEHRKTSYVDDEVNLSTVTLLKVVCIPHTARSCFYIVNICYPLRWGAQGATNYDKDKGYMG